MKAKKKSAGFDPAPGRPLRRILVADQAPLLVLGLKQAVASEPDLEIGGHAVSAREALSTLRGSKFDLLITEISLPEANGLELIKHAQTEHPQLPVLVFTARDEQQFGPRALRAGAAGYVMKTEGAEVVLAAIRDVLGGGVAISDALKDQLIARGVKGKGAPLSPLDRLSDRELEILSLLGQRWTSTGMAQLLHLSVKTVESHRAHLKEKLCLANSAALTHFAMDWADRELFG